MIGVGRAWTWLIVALLGCERRGDPNVIRSDEASVAPSVATAPSSSGSGELSTAGGVDPDSSLKMGVGGGSVSSGGSVTGLESLGGSADAGAGGDASAIVARNRWRFKACFTKALAKDPKAEGKIVVKVEIAGDGAVKSATAASTTAGKDLTDCVVNAFDSMKFTASDAGATTFEVPIVLNATK